VVTYDDQGQRAALEYQSASSDFGLIVSIPKTQHMVAVREVCDSNKDPIQLNGDSVDCALLIKAPKLVHM